MHLSAHFIEQWRTRIGGDVTEDLLRIVIADSVRVNGGRSVRTIDGGVFRSLSVYWHPELSLVCLIDPHTNTAVTVLSGDCVRGHEESGKRAYAGRDRQRQERLAAIGSHKATTQPDRANHAVQLRPDSLVAKPKDEYTVSTPSILIDFAGHEAIFDRIAAIATEEFRSAENQILYWLCQHLGRKEHAHG